jgi:hypothetical protein
MLEIVWRNPRPPARRSLQIAEVGADESTAPPMWIIHYHSIRASGWPENEYRLLVNRDLERLATIRAAGSEVQSCTY